MTSELKDKLSATAARVDAFLETRLSGLDAKMHEPMMHAALGGKKMRAFMVEQSASLFDVPVETALPAMAAIEAMHGYSLVHDDLPAMDDDDIRRGKLTVHKAFDEATAILVGDALQTLSFELISELEIDAMNTVTLSGRLAKAAGANGMVLGQAQDIAAETAERPLTLDEIKSLQANKTGALIWWSATAGAVMAGAEDKSLSEFANALGLAFQIHDDILDVEGDAAETGKAVQKDSSAGKATFVSLLGLDAAKNAAKEEVARAKDALSAFGDSAVALRQLADYTITRNK